MVGILVEVGERVAYESVVVRHVSVETVNKTCMCVVMTSLSCMASLVVNYVETYILCESSPFVIIWVRGG